MSLFDIDLTSKRNQTWGIKIKNLTLKGPKKNLKL